MFADVVEEAFCVFNVSQTNSDTEVYDILAYISGNQHQLSSSFKNRKKKFGATRFLHKVKNTERLLIPEE